MKTLNLNRPGVNQFQNVVGRGRFEFESLPDMQIVIRTIAFDTRSAAGYTLNLLAKTGGADGFMEIAPDFSGELVVPKDSDGDPWVLVATTTAQNADRSIAVTYEILPGTDQ